MENTERLKYKAISGVAWNAFGRLGTQVIGYIFTFILIRLLLPGDFGLMAILLMFIGFMTLLLDFGLGATIVQSQSISEKEINTMGTLNLVIGIFLMCIFCWNARRISIFFNETVLESLIYLVSLGFAFNALIIVPRNLHIKNLRFKKVSIIELIAVLISGIIAVWMAMNGFGVWALVFQYIIKVFIELCLYFTLSIHVPRISFAFSEIKNHLKFSSTIFGSALILQVADSVDSLLIGKVFNKSQLGIYNKSITSARLPSKMISSIIARVMFPSFSKIQNDISRMANGFIKIHKLVLALTMPLMILLFFYAEHIIILIAGEKWSAAIPIVQVFSLAGIAKSIIALLGPVILSLKKEKYIWRSALYKNVLLITGTIIGLKWGILGIAIGKTIADFLFLFIFFHYIYLVLNISFKQIFNSLIKVFCSSILMIVLLIFINNIFNLDSYFLELVIGVAISLSGYFLILYLLKEKGIKFMLDTFSYLLFSKTGS